MPIWRLHVRPEYALTYTTFRSQNRRPPKISPWKAFSAARRRIYTRQAFGITPLHGARSKTGKMITPQK